MLKPDLSPLDIFLHFVLSMDIGGQVADERIASFVEASVDQTFVRLDDQRHG